MPFALLLGVILVLLSTSSVHAHSERGEATGLITGLLRALGNVHGLDNGAALREGAGLKGLLGIFAAMFVVVSLATAIVEWLRKPRMRIVVRVAGSWVVVNGTLMLGWHFRPAEEARMSPNAPHGDHPAAVFHVTKSEASRLRRFPTCARGR